MTVPSYDADFAQVRWRKSSYSGGANDCVEISEFRECVAVRDSKNLGIRPLMFSRGAMCQMVRGIVQGEI
ncbi:DUF397 domain-containing protein [Streptomyces sp. NBC_00444]